MIFKGTPVSEGLAVGKAHLYRPFVPQVCEKYIDESDADAEKGRYMDARRRADEELSALQERLISGNNADKAQIFAAHRELLIDPAISEDIACAIMDEHKCAELAVHSVFSQYIRVLSRKKGHISERAADLGDVERRLLRCLQGLPEQNLSSLTEPVVVVAKDLLPSDTASLDKRMVLAIVAEEGGKTSHSAIIARSLEIPAILGLTNAMELIKDGQIIMVDALRGEIITEPDAGRMADGLKRAQIHSVRMAEIRTYLRKTPITSDGHRVDVELNIGSANREEIENISVSDGVGLFRTEFLYMGRDTLPDEEEQLGVYKNALLACGKRPMILRTLDIGGDKKLPALQMESEENPFLGMRALRLCFEHQDVFRTQLRAALRASVYGNLWIMFPMVGSVDDIVRAKAFVEDVKNELTESGVEISRDFKLGIMIEIPSVAIIADEVAELVDFASIGTNDLTQYTLAVDRMNPRLSEYCQSYHPAVLRLIQMTARAFNEKNKPIGVCGELGGDPFAAAVLIGFGIDRLSMSISSVAAVKKLICTHSVTEFQEIAATAMRFQTSADVQKYLAKVLSPANC